MPTRKDDYVTLLHEMSGLYARAMLTNFEYYLTVYGTDVLVKRSEKNEMKDALGSAYVFDGDSLAEATETFKSRIVLNRSQLLERYKTTINELDAFTNKDTYQLGDQLEFQVNGYLIKLKVNNIDVFDPYGVAQLYKVTLSGFEEYKLNK